MNKPILSIIIPFYNEKGNIDLVLNGYKKFSKKYSFELICVNNGSTDGSDKIFPSYVRKQQYSFIRIVTVEKNIGYGHGIITGVNNSSGDVVAWIHADMQTHPADVFKAYDIYTQQGDKKIIVKGNRVGRPAVDTFISTCMGLIATILLRTPLYEINAQPKLFHKSFIAKLNNAPDDFLLDLFLLYKARKLKYKISTINVRFYRRRYGKSKWAFSLPSRLKMIIRTIGYIFNLSIRSN